MFFEKASFKNLLMLGSRLQTESCHQFKRELFKQKMGFLGAFVLATRAHLCVGRLIYFGCTLCHVFIVVSHQFYLFRTWSWNYYERYDVLLTIVLGRLYLFGVQNGYVTHNFIESHHWINRKLRNKYICCPQLIMFQKRRDRAEGDVAENGNGVVRWLTIFRWQFISCCSECCGGWCHSNSRKMLFSSVLTAPGRPKERCWQRRKSPSVFKSIFKLGRSHFFIFVFDFYMVSCVFWCRSDRSSL